jgi:SET family sugar efflux transporter-like MFS transporter
MSKKQLGALFLSSLAMFTAGNGLIPLLPIYAIQLGAETAIAGYYLSFSYFMLAVGVFIAGWLSDLYQNRKGTLFFAGLLAIFSIWLMGRATNIWQLTILTGTTWFLGGMGVALVNILVGLFAEKTERGKIFGIIAMSSSLGALIGGATAGLLVDRWGFSFMFLAVSIFCLLWPLATLFVEDKTVSKEIKTVEKASVNSRWLTGGILLLLLASLIATIAVFINILGRSLVMNNLNFSAAAIASTGAVGGAIALPLPVLLGWLSDRIGRKLFLILCYLAGLFSMLILTVSTSLWHFWIAASLITVLFDVNRGIGSAFVTDLVPEAFLGKGIAIFNVMPWIGGILGFALTGYAIQTFGITSTFIGGAFLPFMAIIFMILIRQNAPVEDLDKVSSKISTK